MAITFVSARRAVATSGVTRTNAFDVLAAIAHRAALGDTDGARELLIRVLEYRESVPPALQRMLGDLLREHGLFPYIVRSAVQDLSLADQLAYETHRPDNLAPEFVFHSEQALVYERLLAGENVILSAPTSFGKSLIVDAVLAAKDFHNVVIIVPTLALMDECRRRLSRLRDRYKLVTHGSQPASDRNIYIMTQERFLEVRNLPAVDFFVIDEFYKLDPGYTKGGEERAHQLNIAFRELLATGAQYYLLGPNITNLTAPTDRHLRATFITTSFTTVATDIERISAGSEDLPDALAQACLDCGPGTLVFCRSPQRTRDVANWLLERGLHGGTDLDAAADWVAESYHPDWMVGKALRHGIGVHHGKLPRALGHHMVRLFNEGRLPYLLVTSTLIEGVNTSARSIIVLDNKIATRKYDYFTFSNIRGRSGRMSRHYVGRVVVFNAEPLAADLTVDVPALSQSSRVGDEVLLQIPEEELTPESVERLRPYFEQSIVDISTLRANRGVSPARQMDAARSIADTPARAARAFSWNGPYPSASQVRDLGDLLFTLTGSSNVVRTSRQLSARVNILRHERGDLKGLIDREVESGKAPDDAVEESLEFVRNWAQFKIPSALSCAAKIAEDVLARGGYPAPSDVGLFAGELENLFQPPFATVLEEYGLPAALTRKLSDALSLRSVESLDELLDRVRHLRIPGSLTPFEIEMLVDTQRTL